MRSSISKEEFSRVLTFLQFRTLMDIRDNKTREEFIYQMAKHYMVQSFRETRRHSKRFGPGGFTQKVMVHLINGDNGWLSTFENGRIPNPCLKTLVDLATALDCALEIRLVPHTRFLKLNRDSEGKGHYPHNYVPCYEDEVMQAELDMRSGKAPEF